MHVEAESAALSGGAAVPTTTPATAAPGSSAATSTATRAPRRRRSPSARRTAPATTSAALRQRQRLGADAEPLRQRHGKAQISLGATASGTPGSCTQTTVALGAATTPSRTGSTVADSGNVNLDDAGHGRRRRRRRPARGRDRRRSPAARSVQTDHTGYTGSGFVGGCTDGNKGNAQATFSVSSAIGRQRAGDPALRQRHGRGQDAEPVRQRQRRPARCARRRPRTGTPGAPQVSTVPVGSGSNAIAYRFDDDRHRQRQPRRDGRRRGSAAAAPTEPPTGTRAAHRCGVRGGVLVHGRRRVGVDLDLGLHRHGYVHRLSSSGVRAVRPMFITRRQRHRDDPLLQRERRQPQPRRCTSSTGCAGGHQVALPGPARAGRTRTAR